jgi:hypothetical protein
MRVRGEEADGQEEQPAGEHLVRRRRERVAGHRQPRGQERADGPHDRRGEDEQQSPERGAAARPHEQREAGEADEDGGDGRDRRAVAARRAQHDDPQRDGADDQRREPGGHVLLGDEEHGVRAGEEAAGEDRRPELGRGDPERGAAPAPPGEPAEQQGRADEAHGDGEERRDRLARELDPEVRRPPDDVDGRERDPHLRPVLHSASSGAGRAGAFP